MNGTDLIETWLVEDHDAFRRSLTRLCTPQRGLAPASAFATAESMLAALAKANSKPQVLLLDLGLPGRSGLEVIAEVHQHAPDCRVVILTVFEDEAKISQAISAGACGYLLKTATPDEIAEAVLEASHGGSPMSPHVASSIVKIFARLTKPAATSQITLSPREHDLLRLMVEGLTAKEIAARLEISIHTADTHTRNLFSKLGVHSRAAAVARAMREKLV